MESYGAPLVARDLRENTIYFAAVYRYLYILCFPADPWRKSNSPGCDGHTVVAPSDPGPLQPGIFGKTQYVQISVYTFAAHIVFSLHILCFPADPWLQGPGSDGVTIVSPSDPGPTGLDLMDLLCVRNQQKSNEILRATPCKM